MTTKPDNTAGDHFAGGDDMARQFDAIVAAFGNQLRCEAITYTGGRCLRLGAVAD